MLYMVLDRGSKIILCDINLWRVLHNSNQCLTRLDVIGKRDLTQGKSFSKHGLSELVLHKPSPQNNINIKLYLNNQKHDLRGKIEKSINSIWVIHCQGPVLYFLFLLAHCHTVMAYWDKVKAYYIT